MKQSIKHLSPVLFLCIVSASSYAVNSTKIHEHTDASGKITVAVFERQAGSPLQHFHDFAVPVPEQFVVIGGGVEGARRPLGHLLTASYPNNDYSAWLVSTKDHLKHNPTKIKAWAIGLKVKGLSSQQLRNYLSLNVSSSDYVSHPDTSIGVPQGYTMVGGGFKVNWSGVGNLATASYPETYYTWRVKSKDHRGKSKASAQSYAIGLKSYIPGVGHIHSDINFSESGTAQHPSSSVNVTPGYALTSCGALVKWRGQGNLLWKIKPYTTGNEQRCEAASKDHMWPSPATITSYSLGIMAN